MRAKALFWYNQAKGDIENYLIHYERENQAGPKQSRIILFKTEPQSSLKELLTKALGVLVVVDKKREIAFIDNVKFHIDTVEGLGTFMEVEAIDEDGTIGKEALYGQCQKYLLTLSIAESDLVEASYSDLLLQARTKK